MHSVKESWENAKEILGIETGSIVLLSSAASFFYSSLLKMGFAQDRPIGFLCSDWKDVRLVHSHIRYEADNSMMPLSGKIDVLLSNIHARRDDVTLFQYRPCTASEENLRWLTETMGNAVVCQSTLPSVIAVAFKDIMPRDASEEWLLCELPNCDRLFSMPCTLLTELEEYAEKHEDRILCPLQDFRKTLQAQYDVSWLYAAAYMLSKICSDLRDGSTLYEEFTAALDLALKKSDSLHEAGNLSALFVDSFNRYIGAHPESLIPRGMDGFESGDEAHTAVLYDAAHCYIPDEVFGRICVDLQETASIQQINRALNYDGIQKPEKSGDCLKNTQSIPVCIGGVQKRARYHVLSATGTICHNLRKVVDSAGIEEVREDEY